MGSGHFLVSAADYMTDYIADLVEYAPVVPGWPGASYASPLVGRLEDMRKGILKNAEESNWTLDAAQLTDQALIRRLVLKSCIYGVDKNPLAVELAKVSLWLHSFTVGAPLSFLDHHLRCGDSLLGLRVSEATGQLSDTGRRFARTAIKIAADESSARIHEIEASADIDLEAVRESAGRFRRSERATENLRVMLDFFCSARWKNADLSKRERAIFAEQLSEALKTAPEGEYEFLTQPPRDDDPAPQAIKAMWHDARSIADQEQFVHWEAAFPTVWKDWHDPDPHGGFDAVIGNPPWDRIKLQEVEWFATRMPEVARAPTASARRAAIERLRQQESPLVDEFRRRERTRRYFQRRGAQLRPLSAAGAGRHQPVFALRGTCNEPGETGRHCRTAHAVGHLRRQNRRRLLRKAISTSANGSQGIYDFREPSSRNGAAAILPRRGLLDSSSAP